MRVNYNQFLTDLSLTTLGNLRLMSIVPDIHDDDARNATLVAGVVTSQKVVPYKFGKEFGDVLAKAKNSIPVSSFEPKEGETWICHFNIVDTWVAAAWHNNGEKKLIVAVAKSGDMPYAFFKFLYGGDLPDFLDKDDVFADPIYKDSAYSTLAHIVVNSLIYIRAGQPDLRHHRPVSVGDVNPETKRKYSRGERDDLNRRYGHEEAILVSWDWKKDSETYTMPKNVEAYWRMQRYGPKYCFVKPTMVRAHTRSQQYKNREKKSETT